MSNFLRLLTMVCALLCVVDATAQNDVVSRLNASKNTTVVLPEALHKRLKPENGDRSNGEAQKAVTSAVGYRRQIFADNNSKTAKREAEQKQASVTARFPELRAYITYKAPSWRLRVGDFRTRGEAVDMLAQLKKAFPSYAREMTVVVDRVNLNLPDQE